MEDIWEYIPGLKDTVGGAPVHRNYSFLCTMYSLQGNCTCEKLTRSLDWRLLYRRQFLRSKDLGQEDDDAGLVEGAPPIHIFSIIKRDSLFVCNFVLSWSFYSYISRDGSSLR